MSESHTQNCAYRYTVKRGDSFYLIAHRTGVSLRDLLDANPAIPPARLTVGDVLCIPYGSDVQKPAGGGNSSCNGGVTDENGNCICPETPSRPETPEKPEQDTPYVCPANRRAVVQEGQSASDLQLRYDLSYYTLQSANQNTNLDTIKAGDVVCIPENNFPCPLAATVTLKENESLATIASSYNLPIASLLRVNPCLAPDDFVPGVTIRLPE